MNTEPYSESDQGHKREQLVRRIAAAWADLEHAMAVASDDDLRRLALIMDATRIAYADAVPPEKMETADGPDHFEFTVHRSFTGADRAPHTYVLARDECEGMAYDGPEWAPFNLWSQCEFGAGGPEPTLTKECATVLLNSPGAKELWALIADRYDRPDSIALALPMRCATIRAMWRDTPKLTPSEHKERRLDLKRYADRLAAGLERFFHGKLEEEDAGPINFTQLLTEEEQDQMLERIQRHNHQVRNKALRDAGVKAWSYAEYVDAFDPSRPVGVTNHRRSSGDSAGVFDLLLGGEEGPPVIPELPELVRRIGQLFAADAELPPLQRPHSENAERNYFARMLIRYFANEKGSVSPAIVARVVSMFFPQGMTDNEASKQLGYLPDGRRWPPKEA